MAGKFIKDLTRRVVPAPLLRPLLTWRCNRRSSRFHGHGTEEIFTTIYRTNRWGSGESVSGPGSEMRATQSLREQLPRIIRQYGIGSILDAPCGDFNWMSSVDVGEAAYIGGDIVGPLVQGLNARHGGPQRSFVRLDITADRLPEVDLIICRDCFLHLTFEQIRKALGNFRRSKARYILISTEEGFINFDMRTGGARDVNLLAWPFSLPPPMEMIPELRSDRPDYMGLWAKESLPGF